MTPRNRGFNSFRPLGLSSGVRLMSRVTPSHTFRNMRRDEMQGTSRCLL